MSPGGMDEGTAENSQTPSSLACNSLAVSSYIFRRLHLWQSRDCCCCCCCCCLSLHLLTLSTFCRDLPDAWQQAALPNDPIATNWVYWEALIVSQSPVYQLTRDNLDPESREPAILGCADDQLSMLWSVSLH